VESRLREDVDTAANMERICMAAASVAYNAYLSLSFPDADIRVGDITLKGVKSNHTLLSQIADLLVPEGFAFIQTEVPK
jgi:hypothetical protein